MSKDRSVKDVTISGGIGLFSALAICISWSVNKSILWAILHGFFGILYVIYFALGYGQ